MNEKKISIEIIYGFAELTNDSFPTNIAKQSALYLIDFIINNKNENIDWNEVKRYLDNFSL